MAPPHILMSVTFCITIRLESVDFLCLNRTALEDSKKHTIRRDVSYILQLSYEVNDFMNLKIGVGPGE